MKPREIAEEYQDTEFPPRGVRFITEKRRYFDAARKVLSEVGSGTTPFSMTRENLEAHHARLINTLSEMRQSVFPGPRYYETFTVHLDDLEMLFYYFQQDIRFESDSHNKLLDETVLGPLSFPRELLSPDGSISSRQEYRWLLEHLHHTETGEHYEKWIDLTNELGKRSGRLGSIIFEAVQTKTERLKQKLDEWERFTRTKLQNREKPSVKEMCSKWEEAIAWYASRRLSNSNDTKFFRLLRTVRPLSIDGDMVTLGTMHPITDTGSENIPELTSEISKSLGQPCQIQFVRAPMFIKDSYEPNADRLLESIQFQLILTIFQDLLGKDFRRRDNCEDGQPLEEAPSYRRYIVDDILKIEQLSFGHALLCYEASPTVAELVQEIHSTLLKDFRSYPQVTEIHQMVDEVKHLLVNLRAHMDTVIERRVLDGDCVVCRGYAD